MNQLLSFHGKKEIKQYYVKRLKEHAKADEIVKGRYWQNGKGCAVGCTIHGNSHSAYESELGLPTWLAHLEDTLFEGLDNKNAKKFAVDFILSIPIGKNLDRVKWQFCSYVLQQNLKLIQKLQISETVKIQVSEAIRGSYNVNKNAITTGIWDENAARSAACAAWCARSAAWYAESAAESAARSAESAAWYAESAAYKKYANQLLKLLKKAK